MHRHWSIAEIIDLNTNSGIKILLHWIKACVCYPYNDRPGALAKKAVTHLTDDMQIYLSCHQVKWSYFG